MGVPEHPGNCISCALYVRDFLLEGVSQWTPCPNGPHGYGTVPGARWTIDTEGGHVVVSVSLIRNGYEYGTVPDRRVTIHTESGHVVNYVSRMRSLNFGRSGHSHFQGLDPSIPCCL